DLKYTDQAGQKKFVVMGSYGIGLGRVMGTIVEVYHDNNGIIWPEAVAPFRVHLVALPGKEESAVMAAADKVYADLQAAGIEVLYDDRLGPSAGEKFADSDLLGLPVRVVVSAKTLAENSVELKNRDQTEGKLVPQSKLLAALTS